MLDHSRGWRRGLPVVALLMILLAVPATGGAVANIEEVTPQYLPDYDSRDTVAPSDDQLAAAAALHATVDWNQFGTPSSVLKFGGYVASGISAPDAAAAARQFLGANATLFKLQSPDSLQVLTAAPLVGAPSDYAVVFQQASGGLASMDGLVSVSVVGNAKAGWNIAYAASSLTGDNTATGDTAIDDVQAWTQAANDVGIPVSVVDVTVTDKQGNVTTLEANGVHGEQSVKKGRFSTPKRGARVAYQATVQDQATDGGLTAYDVVVDGQTGELLQRQNIVFNAIDDPTWLAFPAMPQSTPINEFPWNYQDADTRDLWCWTPIPSCKFVAQDTAVTYPQGQASKVAWDVNAATGTPWFQTTGNNADSVERWVNQGARVYGVGHHAVSPTRDYQYPWTNNWFNTKCDPAQLAGNGNDIDAAMTNLFAMHNRMHDFSYYLGFDEAHWNAQQYNYGKPTLPNDAVNGNAQSAAVSGGFPSYSGRDNANMSAGADGQHPTTNMFLWQPLPGAFYAPCVDGDYDMGVIGHEYGHAIENRLIAKGVGSRQGNAAGAMGEAFGDFDALEFLNEFNYVPLNGADPWTEGSYATGNHYNGIRDYLASEPMGGEFPQPGKNAKTDPLNYGSFGFDTPGPEVHSDGEIWVAVQYDIRDLFLDRYPARGQNINVECARGQHPAQECPGNRRWIQDYYDAMVLMPRNPTMNDARNAMLAADVARFGGANQDLLWQAFAQRGFGQLSTQTSSNDTDPTPDFSSPLANNATLVFTAVSKDGSALPVNANIYVGDYQGRATPIADTNPATTNPATGPQNRDNVAQFVPTGQSNRYRAYNFIANAPGYGHVRFMVKSLKAGETRQIVIHFPTNYASTSQGATAAGDGTQQQNLIDDNEATNWGATGAPVEGRQVVVKLGGTEAVTFSAINVSGMIGPGQNRFTALRSFEVYACTAGADAGNPTCDGSNDAGWNRILKSQDDAFPSVNPRPVAPDLILRNWNVPTTTATHVRFVVDENQCTGQASYQGEQDNDPNNHTDCRVGNPPTYPPRNTEVHAAELQVWSSKPDVDGADVLR
jgi:extracellular elastinolytic metalloproteinase